MPGDTQDSWPAGVPGPLRLILELRSYPQGLVSAPGGLCQMVAWSLVGEIISAFSPELISSGGSKREPEMSRDNAGLSRLTDGGHGSSRQT